MMPLFEAVADAPENGEITLHGTRLDGQKLAYIAAVNVKPRGEGNGTKLMKRLTNTADKHGITLEVSIAAEPAADYLRREKFFSRLGFKAVPASHIMRRYPQK